jgi:hypothetical protein
MTNRTGNYCAFYVKEPFSESNLGAHATKDFVYYNQLKAWKRLDSSFPFIDSHNKNYNVRDNSDWEKTLKPRLRERLSLSKNIILFLSSNTKASKALIEEIDYGINVTELPIIVIYPEYDKLSDIFNQNSKSFCKNIQELWKSLPVLINNIDKIPTIHIPYKKDIIEQTLNNSDFAVTTSKIPIDQYYYPY